MYLPRKHPGRADFWILAGAALAVLLCFLRTVPDIPNGAAAFFTVTTPDGVQSYSLHQPGSVEIVSGGVHLTLLVENSTVSVQASDCPDHICQNSGAISRPGQSIICIPGRIAIEITGTAEASDEDFIIG